MEAPKSRAIAWLKLGCPRLLTPERREPDVFFLGSFCTNEMDAKNGSTIY